MKVRLQENVPYDKSAYFDIHDAYFANRGIQAWAAGDIPFAATSNPALAKQHAELLITHVASLESQGKLAAGAPVSVLEVGSGLGNFALNLLRALEGQLGEPGQALLARLRYVFSDYTRINVEQATGRDVMKPWVQKGNVVPALLDMRRPKSLVDLKNKPLADRPVLVFANYLVCVGPTKYIQHDNGRWAEMYAALDFEAPDGSKPPAADAVLKQLLKEPTKAGMIQKVSLQPTWKRVKPEGLFEGEWNADVLKRWVGDIPQATVSYPYGYLGFVEGFREKMADGGLFLITDYGDIGRDELSGLRNKRPRFYGNTVNHGVSFSVFPAFAAAMGFEEVQSANPLASVHFSLFGAQIPASVREAFDRILVRRSDGEDLLDFRAVAQLYAEKKEWRQALRWWRRAIAMDDTAARPYHQAAEVALQGRYHQIALEMLLTGKDKPGARPFDFAFELGRTYMRLDQPNEAKTWYETALKVQDHAVARTNLGTVHERLGDRKAAFHEYQGALKLDPENERAKQRIEALKQAVWEETIKGW